MLGQSGLAGAVVCSFSPPERSVSLAGQRLVVLLNIQDRARTASVFDLDIDWFVVRLPGRMRCEHGRMPRPFGVDTQFSIAYGCTASQGSQGLSLFRA